MKSQILLFFISVYCFNIVVSFRQYPDYRHGAYQKHPDWPNNSNYPQNSKPVYPLPQPAPTYGPSQHVASYAPVPSEVKYAQQPAANILEANQELTQQQLVESASQQEESRYIDNTPEFAQTYQEVPRTYSETADRSFESYGAGHQPAPVWQAPPPNPVYRSDSYPQQISRQWPTHNTYQPALTIPQEPYAQPAYPYRQSSGYQNAPSQKSFYDNYDGKTAYNAPVQAENNFRKLLALKPEIKDHLVSQKKRFLLIHPNGTIEHVDFVDDNILSKSQQFKASDILNETIEKETKKPHEILIHNTISSTTPLPDNREQNKSPFKPQKNNDFVVQRPNEHKEIKPDTVPVKEDHRRNHYKPGFSSDETNYGNSNNDAIQPAVRHVPFNNFRHNSAFKHLRQPNVNPVYEQNTGPAPTPVVWNNKNKEYPAEPQKSKGDIIVVLEDTDDKKYDIISPQYVDNSKNNNEPKLSSPVQTNHESSPDLKFTKIVEANNYNPNPTFDSAPTNEQNKNYNRHKDYYSENPMRPTYLVKDESYETTTSLPYYIKNHPSKSDVMDNSERPTFAPPNPSDYDDISSVIDYQRQESKDDARLGLQSHYFEDANPTTDVYDDINSKDILSDNNDDDISNSNRRDTQYTLYNTTSVDDDQQPNVGSEYADGYSSSVNITTDQVEKEDPLDDDDDDDSPINDNTSDTKENITQPEPNDELGENEVVVDYANFKNISKPMFWFRTNDDFLDKMYENDLGGYDYLVVMNVEPSYPIVERSSKSYVCENGTYVEEIIETFWEKKDDVLPKESRFTTIVKYPVSEREQKENTKTEDAEVSKCET